MQPTTKILARIAQNSSKNKNEVFTKLFRYLLRPDLYFEAYKHLYANNGAATKGSNDDTIDGFNEKKIAKIIKMLRDGTFQPTPVRRTYIVKKNNPSKKRPLGIPTFTDKLVQEVLRMILESVYEPIFLPQSYGFRPNRSCHTALKDLKHQFNGTRWFVEGDIKACFDNINHKVLVGIINNKVKDARLIQLIYKFLKTGYLENWQYYKTYSGTPQGGIISPLLANIYLHKLDKYIIKLKTEFDKPKEKHFTYEYGVVRRKMKKLNIQISEAEGEKRQELIKQYKLAKQELLKTPCKSQTDKVLKYIRYADDFIIGINGSKEDCVEIKRKISEFIGQSLKMELSEEKTLITHSNKIANFLGYNVRVRRDNRTIKHGGGSQATRRNLNNMAELSVPFEDKIHKFIFSKGIAKQKSDGTLFPVHRKYMVNLTDLEIVSTYNAELRGICNYYNMAVDFHKLSYLEYLMKYSCLKTLAAKHKSKISKVIKMFSDGQGGWGVPYKTKLGKKRCYFAKYSECRKAKNPTDKISNLALWEGTAINSMEKRLKAKVCELCGTTEAEHYEIHHVNKLKNLKGKNIWERAMIAKRRKTMVVCKACHIKIHHPKS